MGMRILNLKETGSWIPSGISYILILDDLAKKMRDQYPDATEEIQMGLTGSYVMYDRVSNDALKQSVTYVREFVRELCSSPHENKITYSDMIEAVEFEWILARECFIRGLSEDKKSTFRMLDTSFELYENNHRLILGVLTALAYRNNLPFLQILGKREQPGCDFYHLSIETATLLALLAEMGKIYAKQSHYSKYDYSLSPSNHTDTIADDILKLIQIIRVAPKTHRMRIRTLIVGTLGAWTPSGVSYTLILDNLAETLKDQYPDAAAAIHIGLPDSYIVYRDIPEAAFKLSAMHVRELNKELCSSPAENEITYHDMIEAVEFEWILSIQSFNPYEDKKSIFEVDDTSFELRERNYRLILGVLTALAYRDDFPFQQILDRREQSGCTLYDLSIDISTLLTWLAEMIKIYDYGRQDSSKRYDYSISQAISTRTIVDDISTLIQITKTLSEE